MRKYEPERIDVIVMGDGFYITRRENGESMYVPPLSEFLDVHDWFLNLNDTELEAAIQIYYDRWNFQSGDACDKEAFEALVSERKRRCDDKSSFAPGCFR